MSLRVDRCVASKEAVMRAVELRQQPRSGGAAVGTSSGCAALVSACAALVLFSASFALAAKPAVKAAAKPVTALEVATPAKRVTQMTTKERATPPKKWTQFETWGWRAELPVGWTEVLKIKKDPKKLYDGKWGFHSPNKSFRVRVKVHTSKKLSWKNRTKRTFEKLLKHYPGFKVLGARTTKLNGRELFYLFGETKLKRHKKVHSHLIFRMLMRFPKRQLRTTVTFTGADDRLEAMLPVIEHFADTFAIVDPKSADKAFEQYKTSGATDE